MKENAETKVTKARVNMVWRYPYYAQNCFQMSHSKDDSIPTMCTDGESINYNEEFVNSLGWEELIGVIVHEVLHVLWFHHTRRHNRDPLIWNIAGDIVINNFLKKAQVTLPKNCLYDPKMELLSTEEVYEKVKSNVKSISISMKAGDLDGDGLPKGWNIGGVKDYKEGKSTPSEVQRHEKDVIVVMRQAALSAKAAGKLPAELERLIDVLCEPLVNWREVLSTFLSGVSKDDYSWRYPNERYLSSAGLYLPSLYSEKIGDVVLVFDTSGSIGTEEIRWMAGEVQGILSNVGGEFNIVYCDADVHPPDDVVTQYDDVRRLKAKGGGGTDYRPAFKHISKQYPEVKAIVYFTDGYCSSFPNHDEVRVPILWILPRKNSTFNPKIGKTIVATKEN